MCATEAVTHPTWEQVKEAQDHRRLVSFNYHEPGGDVCEIVGVQVMASRDEALVVARDLAGREIGPIEYIDITNFHVDTDAESRARSIERQEKHDKALEGMKAVERALNGGFGKGGVERGLEQMHSTLLGQFANMVLEEVRNREGDGRLCDLNAPLEVVSSNPNLDRVSDVRQRFI